MIVDYRSCSAGALRLKVDRDEDVSIGDNGRLYTITSVSRIHVVALTQP
jgi:hypothetical protein